MCGDTMWHTVCQYGVAAYYKRNTRFPRRNYYVCGDVKIFIVITSHKCNNTMNNGRGGCTTVGAKSSCWLSAITQRIPHPPPLSLS